jgi:iron-sulfur cluster assembly protein
MAQHGLSPSNSFIRMGVKGGGCSGFTYTLDFDDAVRKFDKAFESNGLTIVVDKKSHLYIHDTEIDWSNTLNDRGFKFNNPSAKGQCGCRTSFMIDVPTEHKAARPTWM